jgi:hypothetical protein
MVARVLAGVLLAAVVLAGGQGRTHPGDVPVARLATDPAMACQDQRSGWLVACPHGNDLPPPGVSLYQRPGLKELEARETLTSRSPRLRAAAALEQAAGSSGAGPATVPCIGDGTSGNRFQVIYARAVDVTDRYSSLLPSLRQWAAEADRAVWLSAGQTGGGRHLRFVTDAACQLQVAQVTLSPLGDDSFDQMRQELRAAGYNRSDRKYLVWVDAAVGICGLGEGYYDQRPTADNLNNTGPLYARVDAPCWNYAELHEIVHTLGAVQPHAPHPSGYLHCTDEADVMCYDDDGGGPVTMTSACPPEHELLLDCGHDDYFSTQPPAGSYLASHWNTANSSFLEPDTAPRSARLSLARATTITYGGRAGLTGRLVDNHSGAAISGMPVTLWARRALTSNPQAAGTATSGGDGSVRFTPAPSATTAYRASFGGSQAYGTASSTQVTVTVRPRVTARRSASIIRYGQTLTVVGTVSPNHAGQRIYLQRRVSSGKWRTAVSATLTRTSSYSLRVKPPVKGNLTYRVLKGGDSDHTSGVSQTLPLSVR